QHPACDALERDQPQKAPAARRIGCPGHHQPLSPWTDGRTNADGCSTRTIGVLADIRLLALPGPEGGVAVYGRRRGPRATVEARARRSRSRVTRLSSMILKFQAQEVRHSHKAKERPHDARHRTLRIVANDFR